MSALMPYPPVLLPIDGEGASGSTQPDRDIRSRRSEGSAAAAKHFLIVDLRFCRLVKAELRLAHMSAKRRKHPLQNPENHTWLSA